MGERNDLPSWGGYTLSEIEQMSKYECSHTPNFNSNPDCPYETDKLGNIIGDTFPSAIEGLSADFNKIVKRIDSEKSSSSSTETKSDKSLLDDLSPLGMKCECPTVDEALQDRDCHLSWDQYFMNIAILTSLRSKDKNTKVGAILVDSKNRIIGTGYNGLPSHIDESLFPTCRDGELHETKYAYTVHAEANALCNSTVYDLTGAKLYCTLFPCNECVKLLLQKGISEIIYLSDKHHDDPPYIASRKLLSAANVLVRPYRDILLL